VLADLRDGLEREFGVPSHGFIVDADHPAIEW